jgi:hypothetical protein
VRTTSGAAVVWEQHQQATSAAPPCPCSPQLHPPGSRFSPQHSHQHSHLPQAAPPPPAPAGDPPQAAAVALEAAGPGSGPGAQAPEVDLSAVDLAEQRSILHELEVRATLARGRAAASTRADAAAGQGGGGGRGRGRGRGKVPAGQGSAGGGGGKRLSDSAARQQPAGPGAKQARISAMFKKT